jgi:hypothetical protein
MIAAAGDHDWQLAAAGPVGDDPAGHRGEHNPGQVEQDEHDQAVLGLVAGEQAAVVQPVAQKVQQVQQRHRVAEVDREPGQPRPAEIGVAARAQPERPGEGPPVKGGTLLPWQ